jgi:hypothetical protein
MNVNENGIEARTCQELFDRYTQWHPTLEFGDVIELLSPDTVYRIVFTTHHATWRGDVYENRGHDEVVATIETDLSINADDPKAVADVLILACQEAIKKLLSPDDVVEVDVEDGSDTVDDRGPGTYLAFVYVLGEEDPLMAIELLNADDGEHARRAARLYFDEEYAESYPQGDVLLEDTYLRVLPHEHSLDLTEERWHADALAGEEEDPR